MKYYPGKVVPGQLWTVLADDGISKNFVVLSVGENIHGIRTPTCNKITDRYKLPIGMSYETIPHEHLVRLEGLFEDIEITQMQEAITTLSELLCYDVI